MADLSIVIPVFNRKDELQCILNDLQKYCPDKSQFSVVVVDDGSLADIGHCIKDCCTTYPVYLVKQKNMGPASARNNGTIHSKSDWILFLDSDVIIRNNITNDIIIHIKEANSKNLVGLELNIQPLSVDTLNDHVLNEAPTSPKSGGGYHTAGMVYSRKSLLRAGGFDESFNKAACEDVELACRMLKLGTIEFIPSIVVYHPSRIKTIESSWKKRSHWNHTKNLAVRHNILAWPNKRTNFPRLRVALSALATTPMTRFVRYFREIKRTKRISYAWHILSVFIVETLSGWSMIPMILLGPVPNPLLIKHNYNFNSDPLSDS